MSTTADPRADPARTMRIDIPPSEILRLQAVRSRSRSDGNGADERDRSDTAYERLLECIYDAVLITDPSGTVVDWNERAGEFFRISDNRLSGLSVLSLISGADTTLRDAIRMNQEANRYTLIEAVCLRWDGSTFPAEIAVGGWTAGAQVRWGFFVRDITVRRQAFEALEAAVQRLKDYDQARTEFVSNVSHELRTPLTSMLYAVSNMLRGVLGKLPDPVVRYLERLDGDCRRLLLTVNDILDIRQIENQALTLALARVPIEVLARDSLDSIRVQAEAKGIELAFQASEKVFFVLCDPRRMERVFLNILGNAVKFTPAGGRIRVRIEVDRRDPQRVNVSFTDTGVGIPAEAVHKVTLRYFKVGDQPIGSGLGLAIAKEIVEMHKGELEIQSPAPESGTGTAVAVRLPMRPRTVLLLADGTGRLASKIRPPLEARGFTLRVVGSGAAATEYFLRASVQPQPKLDPDGDSVNGDGHAEVADALITTLVLPDMQGTDLLLRLKQQHKASRLPMLAVSGEELTPARREVLQGLGIPVLFGAWDADRLVSLLLRAFYSRTGFSV